MRLDLAERIRPGNPHQGCPLFRSPEALDRSRSTHARAQARMFAGLNVDEDDNDSSDDSSDDEKEPTLPPVAPAPSRQATLLPEADDDSPEPAARAVGGSAALLGGIDPDDLDITISTLKAVADDMTLLRSLPFKALRQALGPLAEELLGAANQRGRGHARNSKQGGTRLGGLSPEERLKQMDRDSLNHRVLRAERLERLEQLSLEEGDGEGGACRHRSCCAADLP